MVGMKGVTGLSYFYHPDSASSGCLHTAHSDIVVKLHYGVSRIEGTDPGLDAMEGTMFPGPEQIGTHPTLAHGMSLASLWLCAKPHQHPHLELRDFTHVLLLGQVTSAAQSPSAVQASGTVPCQR